jgi:hypothetical protein
MGWVSWNLATQLPAILCIALCIVLIVSGEAQFARGNAQTQPSGAAPDAPPRNARELDSLVAPIALYPDQLVAQVLAAATYPLQIVDARRWLDKNRSLTGDAVLKAAARQDWDPSVQALVLFPALLQRMDENLQWTTALGNAFLAQQAEVMDAVQRLRQKAQAAGTLQSNSRQKVLAQRVEGTPVIVIRPAAPEVIYIPAYNPAVVFGAAPAHAPYPAMVYPPPAGASVVSFGAGIAVGDMLGGWHGGGWGWGCNWGPHSALYVNHAFIYGYGFRVPLHSSRYGTRAWVHNPAYRGAVPYADRVVAGRYGAVPASSAAAATVAVATSKGSAARASAPNGAAAPVAPSTGSASRMVMPGSPAATAPQGAFTNPKPNPFAGDGAQTRMNSRRGARSMSGAGSAGRSTPPAGKRL